MSMTGSNPSATHSMDYTEFLRDHVGKSITVLGQCFDEVGKRYEAYFCPTDNAMSWRPSDGQANPTIEYQKMADWFATHTGHMLTHCGGVSSSKGNADVWFCQKDKKFCFDNVS